MRRAGLVLAVMLFTLACGAGQDIGIPVPNFAFAPAATAYPTAMPPTEPAATPTAEVTTFHVKVLLDASLTGQDTSITSAWTAYGDARAAWILKNVSVNLVLQGGYRPTFDEEVAGRAALAAAWEKQKKIEPRLFDLYLDQLLPIYKAGFIREYTWTYYADSSWEQPKGLYLTAFTRWMKNNMKKVHIPETLAIVDVIPGP